MPAQVTYTMNSSCDVLCRHFFHYYHYFDYTLDRLSRAVSRVMSNALPHVIIIYLVLLLPAGSSDLPESTTGRRIAFCSVLLRMEFTCARPVTRTAVVSYTAFPPLPWKPWRFISVALVWESPPPDVIRHPALWSPDFPHLPMWQPQSLI